MANNIVNPKILRRSNRINILLKLLNEGDKSRLQLASELGLTKASITQISKELIAEGLISECGNVQRNQTGRREVLLHFNEELLGAVSVNIEIDRTHVSLCTYKNVIKEEIYASDELLGGDDTLSRLIAAIKSIIGNRPTEVSVLGIGIGIAGKVDEERGISVDSHGILPKNFPLLDRLKDSFDTDICVVNNVKAQARAQIKSRDDNFMFVKHSPGIGCAVVVNGIVVEGYNGTAGELGHTVAELNGKPCVCGKRGCLETVASERALIQAYLQKTGTYKEVDEIYAEYGHSDAASEIINNLIERLALAVGNASTLNDPKIVMVTGGLFFQDGIRKEFDKKMVELGYECKIKTIDNGKKIKAYAGARQILTKKLLEV